jgi:hypothetical protein
MTLTSTRIPLTNPGAWSPWNAPVTGDGESSRFAQTRSTAGWAGTRNRVTVDTWKLLVEELKKATPPLTPTTKKVPLQRVVRVESEEAYALTDRGFVEKVPTLENVTTGKHRKLKAHAGALIDLIALGDPDGVVRPSVAFDAALEWAQKNRATPAELRVLNDVVALALCLQAGLDVDELELP